MKIEELKAFDEIMNLGAIERSNYLSSNYPALQECLSEPEIQAIFSSLYDSIIYDYDFESGLVKKQEDYQEAGRRFWHLNHAKIVSSMDRLIMDCGQFPDISHISKASKLSRGAIRKHLDDFEHIEFMGLERKKMRLASVSYINFLFKLAYKGNLKAGALLLQHIKEYSKEHAGNKINAKCKVVIEEF